ncbi:MAG: VWA domain-containing protein [Thermodesulfobacteriota bacterium]
MRRPLTLSTALFAFFLLFSASSQAKTNVLFIVDASGSMQKKVDGRTRLDIAKEVLGQTLNKMPADAQLGLFVYGHRRAKDCTDIELVVPIGGEDAKTINKIISGLKAKGETPIAESLRQTAKSFKAFKGQQNLIILVTDGIEECQGDPCAAARELKDAGLDVAVNIVGFTLGEKEGKALQCVTEITGGKYYAASNAAALTNALQQVQQKVQEVVLRETAEPPKEDNDILAAKNGGTLIFAPNDNWKNLNRDHESFRGPTYGGEGVWGFKDGKPAAFDRIEVRVPDGSDYHVKDFEVLAGDDPYGQFRSLGTFTTLNTKVMPDGWQAFALPKTTAKYVKVVFKSYHSGGYIGGNALRLLGTLDESGAQAEGPAKAKGENILLQSNGGMLLFSPNDEWAKLNDGKPDRATTRSGEGVWAFRREKPATFEAVGILLPSRNEYNLKDFEVLVGDQGPTGAFRSVGSFTTKNTKMMPDGWQLFTFPKVQAKYIKFVFKSDHGGGYIAFPELAVFGKVEE